MELQTIKERVARADYVVDPAAVAEALLRRADLMRDPPPDTPVRRGAHSPRAGGPDLRRRD